MGSDIFFEAHYYTNLYLPHVSFPQTIHFSFLLPVTPAFCSVLPVAVFVSHCHRWRLEAWKTGKYWILFYPLGMWGNWFLFCCWESLKWETGCCVHFWKLLTACVSGNSLLHPGNCAGPTGKVFLFLMMKWFPPKYIQRSLLLASALLRKWSF